MKKIFYSNARRGIEGLQQEVATAIQWLNMLKNIGALKGEEDIWLGLSDWLVADGSRKLTKTEIYNFILNNEITITENILDTPKDSMLDYSTIGLQNRKELVFSLPKIQSWDDDFMYHDITNGKTIASIRFGDTLIRDQKVLVVDEIQSHRHQFKRMNPLEDIPTAPFEKSWYKLMMKRMIRYAAEGNYDCIAWTSGDVQNVRCGSAIEYKQLLYSPNGAELYPGNLILQPEVSVPEFYSISNYNKLVRIVGKVIANKIEAGEVAISNLVVNNNGLIEFYDEVLPFFINKYCKKWGSSTLPMSVHGCDMHSIAITESMKVSVMQGQAMFRYGYGTSSELPISRSLIKRKIAELSEMFSADIILLNTRDDLPKNLIDHIYSTQETHGVFDVLNNNVYIIADELSCLEDIERTFKHEVLGHQGLRAIYKDKLNIFLDKIEPLIPEKEKERYFKKYSNKYVAIEEYIAMQAENYRNPTIWNKIKFIFQNQLREWGFHIYLSSNDIRCILSKRDSIIKKTKLYQPLTVVIKRGKMNTDKVWVAIIPSKFSHINPNWFRLAQKYGGLVDSKTKNIVFKLEGNAMKFKINFDMTRLKARNKKLVNIF